MDQFYKTKLCPFLILQKCNKGNSCTYAHSTEELLPKTNLEKTKICVCWKKGECKNENCAYAHGPLELRSTNGYYKTTICALWLKGHCHLAMNCRHAHGDEELHIRKYKRTEKQRMQKNKKQQSIKNGQKGSNDKGNEKETKVEEQGSKRYVRNSSSSTKAKEKKKTKRKKNVKHSDDEVKVLEEKKKNILLNENKAKDLYSSYHYLADNGKVEEQQIMSYDDVSTEEEKQSDSNNDQIIKKLTNLEETVSSNVGFPFNTCINIQSSRNTSICPSTTTDCSSFISEFDYPQHESNANSLYFLDDPKDKDCKSYRHEMNNYVDENHNENTEFFPTGSPLCTEHLICKNQNSKYSSTEAFPCSNESNANYQSNLSFNSFILSNCYLLNPLEPSATSNLFPCILSYRHLYLPIFPASHAFYFSSPNAFYNNNMNMENNISNDLNINKTNVYCSHNENFYLTNTSSFFYSQIFQSLSITAETLKSACNIQYED